VAAATGATWTAIPTARPSPGLLVLRPVAPIYFANAPRLRGRLLELVDTADPHPRVLVLDLDAVPDIDVTALDLLAGFDADLRRRGVTLWLANPNARPLDMLRRLPGAGEWERRLFRDLDAATSAFAGSRTSAPGDERPPGPPSP
jgi:sulfate permease, SulP family